jgi:hypothetical protein
MKKVAYLYGTKLARQNLPTGAVNRMQDISNLLTEIGFEVKPIHTLTNTFQTKGAILVLVSFPSAKVLRRAHKYFEFIWLDATDSWRLTRKQLFRFNVLYNSVKYVRDYFHSSQYRKADLITYCSRRDLRYDKLQNCNALVLNHRINKKTPIYSSTERFVFVGHGSYPPNQRAVKFLLKCFKSESFGLKLHIYGAGFERFNSTSNVIFEGVGNDEEIYLSKDVHLVPIWQGSGVKYKTLNALAHDLPVISSTEGANGFVHHDLLHTADQPLDFINLMRSISQGNMVRSNSRILSQKQILESDDTLELVKRLENLKCI